MKKGLKFFSLILAVCAVGAVAACAPEEEAPRSRLIGTFTDSDTISINAAGTALSLYGSEAGASAGDLYCTVAPFDALNGVHVRYGYEQRLKLKRDYTYYYQYSITLNNAGDSGKDFAQISVIMEGTFTYEEADETGNRYAVTLEDPTSGTFTIVGATAQFEDIYGWVKQSAPAYIMDIADELARSGDAAYNRYTLGRDVIVMKEEKLLQDDIFYRDVLNDIAPYSDYTY